MRSDGRTGYPFHGAHASGSAGGMRRPPEAWNSRDYAWRAATAVTAAPGVGGGPRSNYISRNGVASYSSSNVRGGGGQAWMGYKDIRKGGWVGSRDGRLSVLGGEGRGKGRDGAGFGGDRRRDDNSGGGDSIFRRRQQQESFPSAGDGVGAVTPKYRGSVGTPTDNRSDVGEWRGRSDGMGGGAIAFEKGVEPGATPSEAGLREERHGSSAFRTGRTGSAGQPRGDDDEEQHARSQGHPADEEAALETEGDERRQDQQPPRDILHQGQEEKTPSSVGSEVIEPETAGNESAAQNQGPPAELGMAERDYTADNQGGFSSEASSRSGRSSCHSGHQESGGCSLQPQRSSQSLHRQLYPGQRSAVAAERAGVGEAGVGALPEGGGAKGAGGRSARLASMGSPPGSRSRSRRRRVTRSEPWHFDLSQHSSGEQELERRARRNDRRYGNPSWRNDRDHAGAIGEYRPFRGQGDRGDGDDRGDGRDGGDGRGDGISDEMFRAVRAGAAGEVGGRSPLRSRLGPRGSR